MAKADPNLITVVLTGVAQADELKTLTGVLKKLEAWVQPVHKPQVFPEAEGRSFFRCRVKLAQNDVPRFRAVLDFHSNGWDPSSRFETVREVGSGPDLRYATPADEERVAAAKSENRTAELTQLNCQVNT